MPSRSNLQRKIVVADSLEELEDKTLLAQRPGEPGPDDPGEAPPTEPAPAEPAPTEPEEAPGEESPEDDDEDGDEDENAPVRPADPPGAFLRYESRITILDAWQYPGSLARAPGWVDRNWAGYADPDPLRKIDAGPCLRVPNSNGEIAFVRIGDYVARQEVRLTDVLTDVRIEAWQRQHFEKLFLPSRVQ
jgi:hypothetical protein